MQKIPNEKEDTFLRIYHFSSETIFNEYGQNKAVPS
jgi:hypothetical protein